GKYQGFQAAGKKIGEVAEGVFQIVASNPKTKTKYLNTLIELILLSNSSSQGIERLEALEKIKDLQTESVEYLQNRITENQTLKSSVFLKKFNDLAFRHKLDGISYKDFESKKTEDFDDLPF